MKAVLTTTDPVLLGFAEVVLADARIVALVADRFTSAIEGALSIFPCRLLVSDDEWARARLVLAAAGLGAELVPLRSDEMRPALDGGPRLNGEPA